MVGSLQSNMCTSKCSASFRSQAEHLGSGYRSAPWQDPSVDSVKDTAVSEQAKILIITLLLLMLLIMMLVFHVHRQPDSADPSVRFCTRTWTPRQAIDAEKGLLWATTGTRKNWETIEKGTCPNLTAVSMLASQLGSHQAEGGVTSHAQRSHRFPRISTTPNCSMCAWPGCRGSAK